MHLLEKYSLNCGINPQKLGRAEIITHFFPIPFEKYITIHPSSGMPAKNYDYFQDVVDFIKPALDQANIGIVQIGGREDAPLHGAYQLQGQTTIHQTAHIIKHAAAHLGNDSFAVHMASSFDVPLVGLYSIIYPEVAGPFWAKEGDATQICLQSNLRGQKPSYSPQEPEKTVNRIKIEEVISALGKVLGIDSLGTGLGIKTVHIGKSYPSICVDAVPDNPAQIVFAQDRPLNIRFDYLKSKEVTYENIHCALINLQSRKCVLISNREFDTLPFFPPQFRQNLLSFVFLFDKENTESEEVTQKNIDFLWKAKKAGLRPQPVFIKNSLDGETVDRLKLLLMDLAKLNEVQETKISEIGEVNEEEMRKILTSPQTFVRSSRVIYSGGKAYLNKAAFEAGKDSTTREQRMSDFANNLDVFLKEMEHSFIFQRE